MSTDKISTQMVK